MESYDRIVEEFYERITEWVSNVTETYVLIILFVIITSEK